MSLYKICPHCWRRFDPAGRCGCLQSVYNALTPGNRRKVDEFIQELGISKNTAHAADDNVDGKAEQSLTSPVSASNNTR